MKRNKNKNRTRLNGNDTILSNPSPLNIGNTTISTLDTQTFTEIEEADTPVTIEEFKEIEKDLETLDRVNVEIDDDIIEAYNEALVYSKHLGLSIEHLMTCILQRNISDALMGFRIVKSQTIP